VETKNGAKIGSIRAGKVEIRNTSGCWVVLGVNSPNGSPTIKSGDGGEEGGKRKRG